MQIKKKTVVTYEEGWGLICKQNDNIKVNFRNADWFELVMYRQSYITEFIGDNFSKLFLTTGQVTG
jgi:hypothetical protein